MVGQPLTRQDKRVLIWVALVLALVCAGIGVGGVRIGAWAEHGRAEKRAAKTVRREMAKIHKQQDANRQAWRTGICSETCKALGFRTLAWTRTMVETSMRGDIRSEDVCRCGTPDGVLFVRDDGSKQLVENQEASRRNDGNWRELQQCRMQACANGMDDETSCNMSGFSWRGRPVTRW